MPLGNSKTVTQLNSIESELLDPNDLFTFVDVSDPTYAITGTNKKITTTKLASEIIGLASSEALSVFKGDTGDTGPKGDTGDTGPKGDKGDTGPQGDPGIIDISVIDGSTIVLNGFNKLEVGTIDTNRIADDAVTFDKIQNINTNKILGRTSSSAGNIESLSLDTDLSSAITGNNSVPTSTAVQNYLNTSNNAFASFGALNDRSTSSFYRTLSFISKDGGLYAGGYSAGYSILGPNETYLRSIRQIMVPLELDEKILNIYSGGINAPSMYILTDQGNVYSSGYNGYGQLGLGGTTNRTVFQKITFAGETSPIVWFSPMSGTSNSISCGAVTASGKLYMWGYGGDQSLGLGNTTSYSTPQRVNTVTTVRVAAVGTRTAGTSFATITKTAHGLETGDSIVVTREYSTIIPLGTYVVTKTGDNTFTIPTMSTAVISASTNTIDYGTSTDNISFTKVFVHNNYNFTYAIDSNKKVYSCGYNNFGQLGLGDLVPQRNTFTLVPDRLADDVLLSHYYTASAYIIHNNEIWSCGANNNGQLGLGDDTYRNSFVKINGITCAQLSLGDHDGTNVICLQTDGSVRTWGRNNDGQCGTNNTTNILSPATPAKIIGTTTLSLSDTDIIKVITHDNYTSTAILKSDGTIWTTGYNGYGQCGRGDTVNKSSFGQIIMDGNLSFKDISFFGYDSGTVLIAVDQNDNLWGAGYAADFMLGQDTTNPTVLRKLSIV